MTSRCAPPKAFLLVTGGLFTMALAPVTAHAESADGEFVSIYTAEYEWRQHQQGPSENGPKSAQLHLRDVGPAAQAEKLARWTAVSRRLKAQNQLGAKFNIRAFHDAVLALGCVPLS